MKPLISRITNAFSSKGAGLTVFAVAAVGTFAVLAAPRWAFSVPGSNIDTAGRPIAVETHSSAGDGLKINAALTRTKLVQGERGSVEVHFTVEAPLIAEAQTVFKPSDIVVVLDRSGSMSESNKLPYAKRAIIELIERMRESDRFALVSFDDRAIIHRHLGAVTAGEKQSLFAIVNSLQPGGSTNLSAGLESGYSLLAAGNGDRSKRLILLSDGHANMGIVDSNGLSHLVRRYEGKQAVLSTIGMGLGFNEMLLAALADYGMGKYAYLERLEALGEILTAQLEDARMVYAAASELEWFPGPGVRLVDAGGYPINPSPYNSSLRIPTGQILSGKRRGFFLTFEVPTYAITESSLGRAVFRAKTGSLEQTVELGGAQLAYAVVSPERRAEAVASIDKSLFKKNWLENSYGRMQAKLGNWIRQGDQLKAQDTLEEYRRELKAATEHAPELQQELEAEVSGKLKAEGAVVADAFSGPAALQAEKRNRAAKAALSSAYDSQRSTK